MRNFLNAMDEAYDLGYQNAKDGIKDCPFDKVKQEAEVHQWQCGYNDWFKDNYPQD